MLWRNNLNLYWRFLSNSLYFRSKLILRGLTISYFPKILIFSYVFLLMVQVKSILHSWNKQLWIISDINKTMCTSKTEKKGNSKIFPTAPNGTWTIDQPIQKTLVWIQASDTKACLVQSTQVTTWLNSISKIKVGRSIIWVPDPIPPLPPSATLCRHTYGLRPVHSGPMLDKHHSPRHLSIASYHSITKRANYIIWWHVLTFGNGQNHLWKTN